MKKGLSRRPDSDQGVDKELAWRSIAFLRRSCWRFTALSRRFHCAFTALTMHALRFHGVRTALTACWRRSFAQQNEVFVSCMFVLEVETMPFWNCWTCILASRSPACWRTSDIVKGMFICISRFYSILFAFVIIVCISHFFNLFCLLLSYKRRWAR